MLAGRIALPLEAVCPNAGRFLRSRMLFDVASVDVGPVANSHALFDVPRSGEVQPLQWPLCRPRNP